MQIRVDHDHVMEPDFSIDTTGRVRGGLTLVARLTGQTRLRVNHPDLIADEHYELIHGKTASYRLEMDVHGPTDAVLALAQAVAAWGIENDLLSERTAS